MRADLIQQIDAYVRDEAGRLRRGDIDAAVESAVRRYGEDRPRQKVADVVGSGGDTLPLPVAWETGSQLVTAEYPIGQSPICYVPGSIYTAPAGDVIRLGASLGTGAEVRLTFTVAHQVTDTVDTIPSGHRQAVAAYAASLLLEQLAAAAINDGDPTIAADATNRLTKSGEYAKRAKTLKAHYAEMLGLGADDGSPVAQGTTVAWPSRPRFPGRR